jgi:hypothetical protein
MPKPTLFFFEQIVLIGTKNWLIECAKIRLFCSKVHFNYKLLSYGTLNNVFCLFCAQIYRY